MKDKIKLSVFWIFSFLVIIFMMTFSSHAESSPYPLPYIVSNENIANYSDFNTILTLSKGLDLNNLPEGSFGYPSFEGGRRYFTVYIPSSDDYSYEFTLSNSYDSFDYSLNSCQLHLISSYRKLTWHIENGIGPYFYGSDGIVSNVYITFFANSSDGYGSTLQPKYSMTNYVYDDNQYQVVFGFGNPTPPYTGHATAPEEFDSAVYPTGHAKPNQVPSAPTINNYSWTTHNNPTIDTTNLESLVESLINIVIYNFSYLFTNLAGLFNNLISNISSLIAYIGQLIEYYGNLIISNIQNAITTFYNNMVSLFDPVLDGITYLVEPLDQDIIYDNISTTSLVTNISTIQTSLTSFQAAFTGVSEPSSYTIPIHLENLPSNWFGNQTTQYIDLGVINGTVKDGLRLFVWAMVTYSLVVTIFDSIANYINGGGDES